MYSKSIAELSRGSGRSGTIFYTSNGSSIVALFGWYVSHHHHHHHHHHHPHHKRGRVKNRFRTFRWGLLVAAGCWLVLRPVGWLLLIALIRTTSPAWIISYYVDILPVIWWVLLLLKQLSKQTETETTYETRQSQKLILTTHETRILTYSNIPVPHISSYKQQIK